MPTFIQIIDLTEEEEEEYWMVVSAIFEGRETSNLPSELSYTEKSSDPLSSTPLSDPINNKVSSMSFSERRAHNHCVAAVVAQAVSTSVKFARYSERKGIT